MLRDLDGGIRDCKPQSGTQGYFACIAITQGNSRYFVKCVRADSQEALFWNAWQRGALKVEGRFYRLVPPIATLGDEEVSILVYPELREIRGGHQLSELDLVVRGIADFNSDHLHPPEGLFPAFPVGVPRRAPSIEELRLALGIGEQAARELTSALRRIEAQWNSVTERMSRFPSCLCHMDLVPGNFVLRDDVATILDFGAVGTAPVGADLHAIARSLRPSERRALPSDHLVATYSDVFAGKGIDVDVGSIRWASDAHFAWPSRKLNPARGTELFHEAVSASLALVDAAARPD